MKKPYEKPATRRLTSTGELMERLKELPETTLVERFTFIVYTKYSVKPGRRIIDTTGKLIGLLGKFPKNTVLKEFTIELFDKQMYPIKIEQK